MIELIMNHPRSKPSVTKLLRRHPTTSEPLAPLLNLLVRDHDGTLRRLGDLLHEPVGACR
jgi:hypothetical protein